jgi:hypothetical protein
MEIEYEVLTAVTVKSIIYCLLFIGSLLCLLFYSEVGGSMFLKLQSIISQKRVLIRIKKRLLSFGM